MSKQPKALELATHISLGVDAGLFVEDGVVARAAALLRTQHQQIKELVDVLRRVDVSIVGSEANAESATDWRADMEATKEFIRAALSRIKEQQ